MEALYCNTYPLLPDRLTYPELLPEKFHKDHIYRDKTDLLEKLKESENFNPNPSKHDKGFFDKIKELF